MNIVIKSIDSFDFDPMTYVPVVQEELAINLTFTIGLKESSGGDNFNLFVCSPEWISMNLWEPEIFRHTLIIREYNIDEIIMVIISYIEKCSGKTWQETAEKLSHYLAWEYESYQV